MIKLGFLGVQSKHAEFFGTIFNKECGFKNVRVSALWGGDTSYERTNTISKQLGIHNIVKTPFELINEVDAVLILLRNGNEHMQYAVESLKKGKPVFVDKPFTVTLEDARTIIDTAEKTGTPLFGGSTLRHLHEICEIKRIIAESDISHVSIRYKADVSSPFGGYYFYGSHLTEICTALCGKSFIDVKALRRENEVSAIVRYPKITALLHSAPHVQDIEISLFGSTARHFSLSESGCYRSGMEKFVNMLNTGVMPLGYEELFSPVQLLYSIIQSYEQSDVKKGLSHNA